MNKDLKQGSGVKSGISPADGKPMLSDVIFSTDIIPNKEHYNDDESAVVRVVIEEEEFDAFYDYTDDMWYVNLGGITVGWRQFQSYEITSWFYKNDSR